jgi:hypothetical protein
LEKKSIKAKAIDKRHAGLEFLPACSLRLYRRSLAHVPPGLAAVRVLLCWWVILAHLGGGKRELQKDLECGPGT